MKDKTEQRKNNKGGRPKTDQPKRNRLVTWVNDEEKTFIDGCAEQTGKKTSDFIRECLLHTTIIVKERVTPEQSATLIELNQILRPIAKNISEAAKYSKFGLIPSRKNELMNSIKALMSISKYFEDKLMKK